MMDLSGSIRILLVVSFISIIKSSPGYKQDYCHDDTFYANCDAGQVIVMKQARYGRMQLGSCLLTDFGYLGCSSDVLNIFDYKCSGQRSCTVKISDLEKEGVPSCNTDLKNYLEAQYHCQKVKSADSNGQCCVASDSSAKLTAKTGVIASIVSHESRCGGVSCPWLISASSGQNISLSITDFMTYNPESEDGTHDSSYLYSCNSYLVIKDGSKSKTVCGSGRREKHILTSNTHELEVTVVADRNSHFLLNYTVTGCADPETPEGGSAQRDGDQVFMECNTEEGKVTWRMKCEGDGVWVGSQPQCVGEFHKLSFISIIESILSLPIGWMVLVILCIVSPILSIIVIIIAAICMKSTPRRPPLEDTDMRYVFAARPMPAHPTSSRGSYQSLKGRGKYPHAKNHPLVREQDYDTFNSVHSYRRATPPGSTMQSPYQHHTRNIPSGADCNSGDLVASVGPRTASRRPLINPRSTSLSTLSHPSQQMPMTTLPGPSGYYPSNPSTQTRGSQDSTYERYGPRDNTYNSYKPSGYEHHGPRGQPKEDLYCPLSRPDTEYATLPIRDSGGDAYQQETPSAGLYEHTNPQRRRDSPDHSPNKAQDEEADTSGTPLLKPSPDNTVHQSDSDQEDDGIKYYELEPDAATRGVMLVD